MPSTSHAHYFNEITNNNLQGSLTDQQYKNLLNHIDKYIATIVTEKLKTTQQPQSPPPSSSKPAEPIISKEMSLLIGKIVQENIVHHKYHLNDAEIDRIAELIRLKLHQEKPDEAEIIFTQDNLEEISEIVQTNLFHLKDEITNAKPDIDINEIIFRVVTSPKLSDVIEKKISDHNSGKTLLSNQRDILYQLHKDIDTIWSKLKTSDLSNQELLDTFDTLQKQQQHLYEQFDEFEISQNNRLTKILEEIDGKISMSALRQESKIDQHVKIILMEILGFQAENGQQLDDFDIKAWIRNLFVAKDYLEERLNAINVQFNSQLKDELDKSSGILLKQINENLKEEILTLVENRNKELLEKSFSASSVNINFNEDEIKKIVQDALAVYDADKTGQVDYALESAGGEILSTR